MTFGRRFGTGMVVALAVFAGSLAGLAGIYGISGFDANRQTALACGSADVDLAALEPLARGELAALVVRDRPESLPALTFADATGRPRSLSDWSGKVVLLNLWATWCAPCRFEMPALDRLQAALGGSDFEVVTVSIDRDPAVARKFLDEANLSNLPLHTDPKGTVFQALKSAGKAFGMPTTLLLGPDGCEIANIAGPAEWDSQEGTAMIRAAIAAARPGAAPSPQSRSAAGS